jgi:hypothetical protein
MAIDPKVIQEALNDKLRAYIQRAPRQILTTESYRADMSGDFQRLTEACLELFENKRNLKTIERIGLLHTIQDALDNNWSRIERLEAQRIYKDSWPGDIPEDIATGWVNYIKELTQKHPNTPEAIQESKILLMETWETLESKTLETAKKSLNTKQITEAILNEAEKPHTPEWPTSREHPTASIKAWREQLTDELKEKTPHTVSQKNIQEILKKYPILKNSPVASAPSIRYVSAEIMEALEPLEIKKCVDSYLELQMLDQSQLNELYKNFKNDPNPDKKVRDFLIKTTES